MIEARGLSKRYGDKAAVDSLSFTVRPGHVTGFLGPNGAGKTTTMRLILGLDRATGGSVTVNGKPFPQVHSAMREVGALLDAKAVHGGRSAHSHLLCLARTNSIPRSRVDTVLAWQFSAISASHALIAGRVSSSSVAGRARRASS